MSPKWYDWFWMIPLGVVFSPLFGIVLHAKYGITWGYLTLIIVFAVIAAGCDGDTYD